MKVYFTDKTTSPKQMISIFCILVTQHTPTITYNSPMDNEDSTLLNDDNSKHILIKQIN